MRRGSGLSCRKLVLLLCLLFILYLIISSMKSDVDIAYSSHKFSHKALAFDLGACKHGKPVEYYTGYTNPCDIHGINKTHYAKVLAQHASKEKTILLVMVDFGTLDIGLNFYEASLKKQGIANFLFLSVDKMACLELEKRDLPCHIYQQDPDAHYDSVYYSKDFLRKMNYRTFMILDALELGYTVLHTDVDMHFFDNPFNQIKCDEPWCDMAILNDLLLGENKINYNAGCGVRASLMLFFIFVFILLLLSIGFLYIRPSRASLEVYKYMAWMAFHKKLDDQIQLNKAIEQVKQGSNGVKLEVFLLSSDKFMSGSVFWKNGEISFPEEIPWKGVVVVHNNWIVSMVAKEYRFKEMGMWVYEKDGYFSDVNHKYLVYDNPLVLGTGGETARYEMLALRSAFAIGQILKRTVILPKFHCFHKGKVKECNILCLAMLRKLHAQFPDYREHYFLQHPKVPNAIKQSQTEPYLISSKSKVGYMVRAEENKKKPTDKAKVFTPASSEGATSSEILSWFGNEASAVLHFHSLYGAFNKFDEDVENKLFEEKVQKGFVSAGHVQRDAPQAPMNLASGKNPIVGDDLR